MSTEPRAGIWEFRRLAPRPSQNEQDIVLLRSSAGPLLTDGRPWNILLLSGRAKTVARKQAKLGLSGLYYVVQIHWNALDGKHCLTIQIPLEGSCAVGRDLTVVTLMNYQIKARRRYKMAWITRKSQVDIQGRQSTFQVPSISERPVEVRP